MAIRAAKWSKGNVLALFLALTLASAVLSMFFDNLITALLGPKVEEGLARSLGGLGQGSGTARALLFFWTAGILSLFVSTVPATLAFFPLFPERGAHGGPANPRWWSLDLGVGFAGLGTPFASAANLAVMNLSKPGPWPLRYEDGVSVGLPTYLLCGLLGSGFLWTAIRVGLFL